MKWFHRHKWGKWQIGTFHVTKISYYGEKYEYDDDLEYRICEDCGKREIDY